jgi:hypothetical protein
MTVSVLAVSLRRVTVSLCCVFCLASVRFDRATG